MNGKAVHAVALFMKNTNLDIVILGVYTLTVVVVTVHLQLQQLKNPLGLQQNKIVLQMNTKTRETSGLALISV